MRDHAIFQANAFTARELGYIQTSIYYRKYFGNIVKRLEDCKNPEEEILPDLRAMLDCFIEYKKDILKSLMQCMLKMNFPPTHINHQINEAMEFRGLLAIPEHGIRHSNVQNEIRHAHYKSYRT